MFDKLGAQILCVLMDGFKRKNISLHQKKYFSSVVGAAFAAAEYSKTN